MPLNRKLSKRPVACQRPHDHPRCGRARCRGSGQLGPARARSADRRDRGGPGLLIGHVDITPENVVFRDGLAYALIDFDLAKPATRADEMFNAMLWWGPHKPSLRKTHPP
jgi:Ser/Thr protein kinase RdoA (MazF antagonist)